MSNDDKLNELLVKCWRDADTRKRFIANPAKVLGEHGIEMPPGIEVVVVEDTAAKMHVVLPPLAAGPAAELSDAQLDAVSGGAGTVPRPMQVTSEGLKKFPGVIVLPTSKAQNTCSNTGPNDPCTVVSQREHKKDIGYLSQDDELRLADELMSFRLATYHYKTDSSSDPHRLGFIIDDVAPSVVVAKDGEHVDLYAYTTMAVAALRTQQQQIAALQEQVDELKRTLAAK
jgi:hypothetical protein